MKNYFTLAAKTTLILVYLVIIAGALVRMTGSGMGCPDWPKCFGYYIPPTDIKELTWTPNREFEEGQVIIKDEKLWVAKSDFKTNVNFDESQWRLYTKHDCYRNLDRIYKSPDWRFGWSCYFIDGYFFFWLLEDK
jgi:cytochrome c oxidase assembly protein subunit 15